VSAVIGLDLSCLEATPETGVERYARRLAEHLPEAAPHMQFLILTRPGRPVPVVSEPARVVPVPSILPRLGWRETALPRALKRLGISLLHAPVAAIPLRAAVPRIATVHDVPAWGEPGFEGRLSRNRLRLFHAVRAAKRIIVPSSATRADLIDLEPRCEPRIRVIHHGVDPDFRPKGIALKRSRYSIPDGVPYLLWVGTVRQRKDPLVLIRAFASLAETYGDLHCVVCGDARMDEATLRAPVAGTPAEGRLLLTGYAAREDLPDLYREAACLVLPSRIEGFGLPALEAMACGRPVITSQDPALKDLVGDAGLSFRTGDATDLAETITTLLEDDGQAEALAACARARAAGYSWGACARAHADVYDELL